MALKIPRFIRHATLYSVGTALRSASSILLLPVYTRFLTPADYGLVEIIFVMLGLIGTLVNFDMTQPIFRFYNEAPTADAKRTVIRSGLVFAGLVNAIATLLVVALASMLAGQFMGSQGNAYLLRWASLTLVAEALSEFPFFHMRAEGQVGRLMSISMLRLALQIGLNLLFLAVFHLGAASLIYANLISCAVQCAVALPFTLRGGHFHVSLADIRKLATLGGPLALAGITGLVVTIGDRFFLSKLGTLAGLGVYALSYRFSQAVTSLIYQPFLQVWEPEQYRIHSNPALHGTFSFVFRVVFGGLALACLAVSLFAPEALRILTTPAFYGAADPLPLLLLAVLFSAMTDFTRLGSLVRSRPANVLFGAMLGAAVSVCGFLLLIPRMGAMGAASAMAVATLARLVYESTRARRLFDMGLDWWPVALVLAASAVAVLVGRTLAPMTVVGVLVKLLLWTAIAAVTALTALRSFRTTANHQELLRLIGNARR